MRTLTRSVASPAETRSAVGRRISPIRLATIGVLALIVALATVLGIGATGSGDVAPAVGPDGLTAAQRADAQRWAAMAEWYAAGEIGADGLTVAQRADMQRWTAIAEWYAAGEIGADGLTRGQRADAERLTGLAGWYAAEGADVLTRGQRADAARLQGLADAAN